MTNWKTVPTEFPESHAELYDLLQREFGVGSYDDALGGQPWFRARMTEIAKVKAVCRARRTSVEQMAIAAWYAKENNIPIRAVHRLLPLVTDALVAYRRALRDRDRELKERELTEAINEAVRLGRQDWFDRLLRAEPGNADQVLAEWRSAR